MRIGDLDNLWIVCEEYPADWQLLLVMADALEESGDTYLSKAFRWMGETYHRPYCFNKNYWIWSFYDYFDCSYLPTEIFVKLSGMNYVCDSYREAVEKFYVCDSYREAVEKLALALSKD